MYGYENELQSIYEWDFPFLCYLRGWGKRWSHDFCPLCKSIKGIVFSAVGWFVQMYLTISSPPKCSLGGCDSFILPLAVRFSSDRLAEKHFIIGREKAEPKKCFRFRPCFCAGARTDSGKRQGWLALLGPVPKSRRQAGAARIF